MYYLRQEKAMQLNLRCFPGCFQHNQCRGGVAEEEHIHIRRFF